MTRLCLLLLPLVQLIVASGSYIKREYPQPRSSEPNRALIHPVCRAATTWASPWDLHGFAPYSSQVRSEADSLIEDHSPVDSVHAERRFEQGFQQIVSSAGFNLQKRALDAVDYTKREYL